MPQQLRAPKDAAWARRGIDLEWVRSELMRVGALCEYPRCMKQAEFAIECAHSVGYVCVEHKALVNQSASFSRVLDGEIWNRLQANFNLIRQIHDSGGSLLRQIEAKQLARAAAERAARSKGRAPRVPLTEIGPLLDLLRRPIKVGWPDEELSEHRSHLA